MKRVLAAMTAALLIISLGSSVALANGGSSASARLCEKGGYRDSADLIGSFTGTVGPFASQGACLRYVARGGVLYVPIGIVLPTAFDWHVAGLRDALAAAGDSAAILLSQDTATEKTAVETLIRRGVRVLILAPQDGAAAATVAREARAAGVKVIAYDRLILNTAAVDYLVTFANPAVGAAMAQYLIDTAGAPAGNNLYLYAGNPADNNTFVFFEGSWERLQPRIADGTFVIRNSSEAVALQAYPTLTHDQQAAIIDQITTYWDYDTAHALAVSNLGAVSSSEKTNLAILAPNDWTAIAISDAFATDPAVTGFHVTGQDAIQPWIQSLIDGTPGMTVFKDPRTLAKDAVAGAVAFLKGRKPVQNATFNNGRIDVRSRTSAIVAVTIDNIQAALIDTNYYQAGDFTGSWPGKP